MGDGHCRVLYGGQCRLQMLAGLDLDVVGEATATKYMSIAISTVAISNLVVALP